jgi:hypothetical protein
MYKDLEQRFLHIKFKVPKAMDEDDIYHPDFVKLANMMKDKINCMLLKDCLDEIPVYSILIGSKLINMLYILGDSKYITF